MKDHERDALFARARGEATPTDDDRRRVRAALHHKLGIAVGASVGVTAAKAAASVTPNVVATVGSAAATTAVAGLSGLAMVKVVAIVVAVAALGVVALPRGASVSTSKRAVTAVLPPEPVAAAVQLPVAPPVLSAPPVREPSTVAAAPEPPPRPREVVAPRPLPAPVAPVAADVPTASPIADLPASPEAAEDLALIKEMQAALRANDAARVLTLVREHEQRFPRSPLAQEREGARALATCALATPAEAAKIGETFLQAYPLHPVAARVRVTCGVR